MNPDHRPTVNRDCWVNRQVYWDQGGTTTEIKVTEGEAGSST